MKNSRTSVSCFSLFQPIITMTLSNFHNLALFICHLFIDGQFRTGHILHDSNEFQINHLIDEIDQLNCSHQIPWLLTDVTKPFSLSWKFNERNDHILQLIFFDLIQLPNAIDDFKDILTFYRLFIFTSVIGETNKKQIDMVKKLKSTKLLNSVILYDSKDISMFDANFENISKSSGVFDSTFKPFDENWIMSIEYNYASICNLKKVFSVGSGLSFIANYLFTHLNVTYINVSTVQCTNLDRVHQNVRLKHDQKFYKEITKKYEPFNNGKSSSKLFDR